MPRLMDLETRVVDNRGRQLPFPKFKEVLYAETADAQRQHAQWAGESLAEFVVAKRMPLEKLGPSKLEKMRKRYHVAKEFTDVMLQAAKETVPAEMAWQYAHS